MPKETQKKIVKDKAYHITPFLTIKGVVLEAKIGKIIVPAVTAALNDMKPGANVLENINLSLITEKLFEQLDSSNVESLIYELLSNTVGEKDISTPLSNPIAFENEFEQDYARLFKVIYHVIEVNFKSFLQETIGDLIQRFTTQETPAQKIDSQESAS